MEKVDIGCSHQKTGGPPIQKQTLPQNERFTKRDMFWSGLRVAVIALLALTAKYLVPRLVANRVERPRSNQSALVGIDDWSHHHLVFSQPSDLPLALRLRLQKEPRFWNQRRMRTGAAIARLVASVGRGSPTVPGSGPGSRSGQGRGIAATEFWSENLGTGVTVGAGNFPAKFSFNVAGPNCGADFLVFNSRLTGTAGQASIVAFNHLYAGCVGTVPAVYWAYNTGGQILTSVVLSPLGDQVAFVHSASEGASLVVLRWTPSRGETVSSPLTLTSNATTGIVSKSAYRACTAPCMTTVAFSNNADDTISSPFYDYAHDVIYVGDAAGVLHKFTNIFNSGTPAESNSHFPVIVDSGKILTSPVLDVVTGNVFVGDSGGYFSYVETTGSTPGAVVRGKNLGARIGDGPIIDSTAARAYVFVANGNTAGDPDSGVYQFTTSFSRGNAGTGQALNHYNGSNALSRGAFDDLYFTSAGKSPTGNLYVCGPASGSESKLALYRLPIIDNVLGAGSPVAATDIASPACYAAANIFNCPNIVFGGNAFQPAAGSAAPPAGSGRLGGRPANFPSAASGASGIIVGDMAPSKTIAGASQVDFITLSSQLCATSNGSGGCVVQASQAPLQ
jgi:hypothetical protein